MPYQTFKLWIDGHAKFLGDKLDKLPAILTGAIKSSIDGMKAALMEAISKSGREQSRVMSEALSIFRTQSSSMTEAANGIQKALSNIEVEVKASISNEEITAKIDTSKLESGLQILGNQIGEMADAFKEYGVRADKVAAALLKNVEKKGTMSVRIEDEQIRKIAGSMRGGGVGVGPGVVASRPGFRTGRKTVGTSAAQLTTEDISTEKGILIVAASNNSGVIYVGDKSTVTADAADATDGFPIAAGASITVPVTNARNIYLIGSASGQKLWWTAT